MDEAVIADIYAAREVDDGTIHARDLAAKIGKNARYIGGSGAISAYLEKHPKKGNILITMGAGDVHKVGGRVASADRHCHKNGTSILVFSRILE